MKIFKLSQRIGWLSRHAALAAVLAFGVAQTPEARAQEAVPLTALAVKAEIRVADPLIAIRIAHMVSVVETLTGRPGITPETYEPIDFNFFVASGDGFVRHGFVQPEALEAFPPSMAAALAAYRTDARDCFVRGLLYQNRQLLVAVIHDADPAKPEGAIDCAVLGLWTATFGSLDGLGSLSTDAAYRTILDALSPLASNR